jgi:outer membrane protein TolC
MMIRLEITQNMLFILNMLSSVLRIVPITLLILLSTQLRAGQDKPLTLDEVLHSVNIYYPKIKIAMLEITKAQGSYIKSMGKFDPTLDSSSRSQPTGGYVSNYVDTQLSVQTLYNKVKLFAGYRNGGGSFPIYYQNYLTNSGGEYRVGMSLPLLQDRLIDKDRAHRLTAEEAIKLKTHDADAIKIKIYQETIKAYWQWVEAGLQLKTFKQLLELAKVRQKSIEQQSKSGELSKLAITENMQQILQREQLLNQGRMDFEQAGINLSLYYRDTKGNPKIPLKNSLPSKVFEQERELVNNMSGLAHHPELQKLENYAKISQLHLDLAENEMLPNLNLTAYNFQQDGSGGYTALTQDAVFIGLVFKFPLLQREAKGKVIRAQSEVSQIRTQKKFAYEQLKNQLSNLIIGIKRTKNQVRLLQEELNLALKVQKGETKKFDQGDSTLFLVNQREQVTTQVQLDWIKAQIQLEELQDFVRFFSATSLL